MRNNLYWVDRKDSVEVARIQDGNGIHRTILVSNLVSATDVAVAPIQGSVAYCAGVVMVPYLEIIPIKNL